MSKEQEIIEAMLHRSWIFKGKTYVKGFALIDEIKDADFTEEQAKIIVKKMIAKGFIKPCNTRWLNYMERQTFVVLKEEVA